MSNLQSAKSAIKAEIIHAKQGMDYYKSRVEILEQALTQLEHAGAPERASGVRTRASAKGHRNAKTAETSRPRRGRRPGRPSASAHDLPYTGGDYWLDLISNEPRSAADILKASVGSLGFEADKAQIQKLRQRLTAALQAMLQSGRIQDSGSGRARRYFRNA